MFKRAPDDIQARERLVEVYKKQNDAARALENPARASRERTRSGDEAQAPNRLVRNPRNCEPRPAQGRANARSAAAEFPSDVGVLRALAEFYIRHKQTPAVNILLDRAAGDARRAFAGGRFTAPLFETMVAVYELRGKQDAARVVAATLAAFNGQPSPLAGAEGRAFDPRLDELLAPDMVGPAARTLLARTGHALDAATALDPRALKATAMPQGEPIARLAANMAQAASIGAGVQVFVASQLGRQCVATGDPRQPALIVGDGFPGVPDLARTFLMLRAFKLMQVRGSSFARTSPAEVPVLIAAWLRAYASELRPTRDPSSSHRRCYETFSGGASQGRARPRPRCARGGRLDWAATRASRRLRAVVGQPRGASRHWRCRRCARCHRLRSGTPRGRAT